MLFVEAHKDYTVLDAVRADAYIPGDPDRYALIHWRIGTDIAEAGMEYYSGKLSLWCVMDRKLKAITEFWGQQSEARAREYVEFKER